MGGAGPQRRRGGSSPRTTPKALAGDAHHESARGGSFAGEEHCATLCGGGREGRGLIEAMSGRHDGGCGRSSRLRRSGSERCRGVHSSQAAVAPGRGLTSDGRRARRTPAPDTQTAAPLMASQLGATASVVVRREPVKNSCVRCSRGAWAARGASMRIVLACPPTRRRGDDVTRSPNVSFFFSMIKRDAPVHVERSLPTCPPDGAKERHAERSPERRLPRSSCRLR